MDTRHRLVLSKGHFNNVGSALEPSCDQFRKLAVYILAHSDRFHTFFVILYRKQSNLYSVRDLNPNKVLAFRLDKSHRAYRTKRNLLCGESKRNQKVETLGQIVLKKVLRHFTVLCFAQQMLGLDKFLHDLLFFPAKSILVNDLDRCLLLFNRREEMQKHLEFLRLKNFSRKLRVAPASINV